MRKPFIGVALLGIAAAALAPLAQSGASASTARHSAVPTVAVGRPSVRDQARFVAPKMSPKTTVVGPTVKFFALSQPEPGHTYTVRMVGTSPLSPSTPTSTVTVKVIPLAFHFTDGYTSDPSATLPACAGGGTALARTLNSGLFKNINVAGDGQRQFIEADRRAEFWYKAQPGGANPNYSGRLSPVQVPTITLNVNGPSVSDPCGRGGNIDINSFDSVIKSVMPASVKTTDLALFVSSNIVLCTSSCGILGYHSAYQRAGHTQTYGTAEFATDNRFNGVIQTSVASHELSEWYDDPFVDNGTPSWGHIGQVSGCQANFETGDPLSGTLRQLSTTTGSKFYVQDLAFYSWFYRQNPSLGWNGWYSYFGTFRSPSKPC